VADSPGLYALGLPVLRRRRSTFICGIEDDPGPAAAGIAAELAAQDPEVSAKVKSVAAAGGLLDRLRAERQANRSAWAMPEP